MTAWKRTSWLITNELRALAPAWSGCLAAVVFASAGLHRFGSSASALLMPAYVVGVTALGALSIGQEYSNRTITQLLTQPIARGRVLAVKLAVLATALLSLYVLTSASAGQLLSNQYGPLGNRAQALLILPVLAGFCLAPWFTMISRGALPATVFTIAVPALVWIGGDVASVAKYGFTLQRAAEVEALKMTVLWWGVPALCAVGVAMTWRSFVRLEVPDDAGRQIQMPVWPPAKSRDAAAWQPTAPRRATTLLIYKELRIQQLPILVGGIYAVLFLGSSLVSRWVPAFLGPSLVLVTGPYALLLAALIGSMASAEERQMGTHEWQLLLPVASRHQWAIKTSVALALTLLLTVGLPMLLSAAPNDLWRAEFVLPVLGVFVVALYVSSVSASGVRALLLSIPALLGLVVAGLLPFIVIGPAVTGIVRDLVRGFFGPTTLALQRATLNRVATDTLWIIPVAGTAVLLLFALANHRSAERTGRRVRRQAAWMAVFAASSAILVAVYFGVIGARYL